ncbi:phosphate ABC transporter ATP-binding protein [Ezakiella peruensis]|uniref:phosphate ABC transporter ATP-binding protein n=1 Tax=Ezakiella peruensis TaxID=1464038 RepID=UPI000C1B31E0|nr:phosphate ABC transporter ATP-binding protein [Ezakiella peruensis]
MTIISTKDLNIYYGDNHVVKNVNIDFAENKITSIIGPSGCGKTTFLVTLNKIIEERGGSYTGEIFYMDKNINSYDINDLRKQIGMVFQKPTPFPLSIKGNVELALKYHNMNYKDAAIEAIKKVSLYDEVANDLDKSAFELSGGQQQRLSIARSIAIKPKVLLLDEPCSSLDIRNTEKIERLLVNLKDEITIIIVTHNLQQAKRISDNTLFMLNGELIEWGPTNQIFENPKDKRTEDYVAGLFG